ncbi:MAG: NEW3 domain-containing protein [Phormidium sp.]
MSKHQRKQVKNNSISQAVVSRNNPPPTTKTILSSYCQQIFKSNNRNKPTKLLWLALFLGVFGSWSSPAFAEGSKELTDDGGERPFLEYRNGFTAGIPRQNTIYVYAQSGETINLGSSAVGLNNGRIDYTAPNGTTANCGATGAIQNRNQEVAGPLPNAGGYTPCTITVGITGVWKINFISPNLANTSDPTPIAANGNWRQNNMENNNVFWIAAWDVTVRGAGGASIPGRTYAKYLPLNMGGNEQKLNSQTFIQTRDGYQYRVGLNGLDPYGFIFFANNKGFTNGSGGPPLYQSVEAPQSVTPPPPYFLNPNTDDTSTDYTHKIFFNRPDINLPTFAQTPGGTTWLLNSPTSPPNPSNFEFTGIEGTPNQTGTAPLNGRFTFNAPIVVPYTLVIDINRDGIFGNANDKIFSGTASLGTNTVNWDVTDGNGVPVPPGDLIYQAQVTLYTGEVHFPLFDAENNPNGIIIERVDPVSGVVISDEVYYDDRNLPVRPTDIPSNPRKGFRIPSSSGAHSFGTNGTPGFSVGFGNDRGIDTWVYVPSNPVSLAGGLTVREADLEITKTHEPANPVPGGQVTYIIRVRNLGPSSLNTVGQSQNIDARVTDTIPSQISNVTWTCAPVAVSSTDRGCRTGSGTGNTIDTRVNLAVNGVVEFRATGTLAADPALVGTTIVNDRAIVARSNDVTDPNDNDRQGINNNIAQDQFTVSANTADVGIAKTQTSANPTTPGQNITYNLVVTATGNTNSTNVVVNDPLIPGFNFVSNSGDCATAFPCNLGNLAPGQTRTITTTLAVPPNYSGTSPVTNTATVASDNDTNPNNNSASAQTTITIPQTADVGIVKTQTTPNPVTAGQNVTYNLVVTATGNTASTNVQVNDTIPAGFTFVSNSGTCTTPFPCTLGNIPAGETRTITTTLAVPANYSGASPVNNSATVNSGNDSNPNNNTSTVPTNIQQTADVVTTKTGPSTVAPGGSITYTITTTNNGPNPAINIIIRDNIPPETTFGSASDGGTFANGVVTFPVIPSLASGTSVTRNITVTAPASGGPLVNRASNTSDTPDPTPNNNNGSQPPAQVTTTITQSPSNADVVTIKSGPSTVAHNGSITYTITTTNNGPAPATNVVVRDALPPEVTFNSASNGGTFANGVVTFPPIPNLAVGETVTRSITATAPASGGPLVNRASNTSDTPDPTPNNNNGSQPPAQVTTTITNTADVVTTKTGPSTVAPNGTITYTITTSNNGPVAATNVIIQDATPPEVTFNSASDGGTFANGVVTFPPIASLAPNSSVTRTVIVTAPAGGGPLVNRASNTSDTPDPNPGNNNGSQPPAQVVTTITTTTTNADVVTTKTGPSTVTPGGRISYSITTTNNGPAPASNVIIRDTLPAGATFNDASDGGTFADGVVTFPPIPTLAPGTSVTRTVNITAPASGGPLVNRVSNTSDTPDPTPGNNNGSQPPAQVVTTITNDPTQIADVVTTKTGPETAAPGGTITYTITTRNNGPVAATNVIIRDIIPPETTFGSASDGGSFANGVVTFPPIPSLAAGTAVTRTVTVTAPTNAGSVVNRASNTSDTPDPTPDNNNGSQPPARVVTTITTPVSADVVVSKTGPATVNPGGTISYTITVVNNGPNSATNIIVRDTLPEGLTFNNASDGGTFANGVVTFPAIPSLASGASITRTVTATAPNSGGPFVNRVSSTSDSPDPNPNNNNGSQPPLHQVTTTLAPVTTDVQVTQTGPATPVSVGSNITFTAQVTNIGSTTANQVVFTNPLPAGVTFVSVTPSQGSCSFANNTITCNLGDLAPSQNVSIPIVVTATTPGTINNPVSISATNDSNPNNNNATAPAQVIVPQTDLEVKVTGPTEPQPVGNNVTFNITVTNTGPVPGTSVVLTNPLPENTTFASATPSQGTCELSGSNVVCNLGTINPGQTANVSVVVTPTTPGTISNSVIVTSPNDSQPANNQLAATVQIVPREPRVRLVKRITSVIRSGSIALLSDLIDDPTDQNDNAPGWSQFRPLGLVTVPASEPLRSGDTVEYTIYFLSDGTSAADNVNICDGIPVNTTFIPDSFAPNSGMQLNLAGATSVLTNVQDSDIGRFFSPLAPLPSGNPCADQSNSNGSVLFNFNQIPNASGSNFGFVRFRVRID